MKKIFENLGEWDNFLHADKEFSVGIYHIEYEYWEGVNNPRLKYTMKYSLADLLSNPSWCKARWGEGELCVDCLNELVKTTVKEWEGFKCCCGFDVQPTKDVACDLFSIEAFKILQRSGQDECIKYIEKTMLNGNAMNK